MTSEARVVANRRNAEKSTGPKTTVGKAIVAQNAVKHGLLAHQDVIAEEDPQQYEAHRQGLLEELSPTGKMESLLAQRIVSLSWRLQRAERLQNELYDYLLAREIERSLEDFPDELSAEDEQRMRRSSKTDPALAVGRMLARDYEGEKMLDRLTMHERRIEGSLCRMMNELQKRQLSRKAGGGQCPPCESKPASEASDSAEQSQSEEVPSSTPAPGGDPSRGRLGHMGTDPACETKPIDAARTVCSVPARACPEPAEGASEETPDGVTTSQTDCAKQSQRQGSAAGVRAVLRPRPRVAWHGHST